MKKLPEDYELNEKDIDSTINWLKIVDIKNASPENAIGFLIYLRTVIHQEWHDKPENLEKYYKEFQSKV
jgi:hypothetical protein